MNHEDNIFVLKSILKLHHLCFYFHISKEFSSCFKKYLKISSLKTIADILLKKKMKVNWIFKLVALSLKRVKKSCPNIFSLSEFLLITIVFSFLPDIFIYCTENELCDKRVNSKSKISNFTLSNLIHCKHRSHKNNGFFNIWIGTSA